MDAFRAQSVAGITATVSGEHVTPAIVDALRELVDRWPHSNVLTIGEVLTAAHQAGLVD